MNQRCMPRWQTVWTLMLVMACQASLAADEAPKTFADFLVSNEIDLSRREAITSATQWNDGAEAVAIKVLRRIDAPESLMAGWKEAAIAVPATGETPAVTDALVSLRGRVTFVAPHRLSPPIAELYGASHYDVVRMVDAGGLVVDVLTRAAPKGWPRWKAIDEPASAVGLVLSAGVGPRPEGSEADSQEWPGDPAGLVVASSHVAWFPDTPLGRLGMDYGLFDSVIDGKKLVAEDAAAFYAMLAAAGRTSAAEVDAAAGKPINPMLLINPAEKWFQSHRGDPVVIEGNAMRATRVEIDEASLRKLVGRDHYWELFVFVETPLLEVNGRVQDTYPIVCCVRELPKGMPSGERISERVKVAGFAFKRYAYTFDDPRPDEVGTVDKDSNRRVTALLIGPQPFWSPPPSEAASQPIWVIAAVAAIVALAAIAGVGILYGNRSMDRAIQKSRDDLPDRVEIPPEDR